jgi:RNA polymerase sigma-70 factor (ECF subfamily)
VLSFVLALGARLVAARDDEAGLLTAVARGERASLRALYDRLSAHALAVALRVLGSRSEAEEVVQDVFMDVWARATQFDPARGAARTWILSMARNRAIDRLRSRGAAARAVDGAFAQALTAPVADATPLEKAEQRQARERIQAALAELPPEQRLVLELGYFEGLSQTEIAERLREPLGTIKSRARAALEKLARVLTTEGAGR